MQKINEYIKAFNEKHLKDKSDIIPISNKILDIGYEYMKDKMTELSKGSIHRIDNDTIPVSNTLLSNMYYFPISSEYKNIKDFIHYTPAFDIVMNKTHIVYTGNLKDWINAVFKQVMYIHKFSDKNYIPLICYLIDLIKEKEIEKQDNLNNKEIYHLIRTVYDNIQDVSLKCFVERFFFPYKIEEFENQLKNYLSRSNFKNAKELLDCFLYFFPDADGIEPNLNKLCENVFKNNL